MATYTLKYANDVYPCKAGYKIDVPDNLIREYATAVNSGIAKVLAEAGLLLTEAEETGDCCGLKKMCE